MPARLALWNIPRVAARPAAAASRVLAGARSSAPVPTSRGLSAALSGVLGSGVLGKQAGAEVIDPGTGRVLFARGASDLLQPASTTKLVTAAAALDVLGPSARLRTRVVAGASPGSIILVGGGDPTLAAGPVPASDYPQPATLKQLAAATARALRAQGRRSARVSYDASLYSGPPLAPGWPEAYVTTGNVTAITPLEVDQGRLHPGRGPAGRGRPRQLPAPVHRPGRAGGQRLRGVPRRRRDPRQRPGRPAEGRAACRHARRGLLTADVGHRGLDAAGEQQRDRREPRPPGRAAREAPGLVQRRGRGGHRHRAAARRARRDPPGRRLRPVTAGPDRPGGAGPAGQRGRGRCPGPPAGRHHRHAGGRFLRHARPRAERLQRFHGPVARPGPGEDRQPEQRGHAGRAWSTTPAAGCWPSRS